MRRKVKTREEKTNISPPNNLMQAAPLAELYISALNQLHFRPRQDQVNILMLGCGFSGMGTNDCISLPVALHHYFTKKKQPYTIHGFDVIQRNKDANAFYDQYQNIKFHFAKLDASDVKAVQAYLHKNHIKRVDLVIMQRPLAIYAHYKMLFYDYNMKRNAQDGIRAFYKMFTEVIPMIADEYGNQGMGLAVFCYDQSELSIVRSWYSHTVSKNNSQEILMPRSSPRTCINITSRASFYDPDYRPLPQMVLGAKPSVLKPMPDLNRFLPQFQIKNDLLILGFGLAFAFLGQGKFLGELGDNLVKILLVCLAGGLAVLTINNFYDYHKRSAKNPTWDAATLKNSVFAQSTAAPPTPQISALSSHNM